MLDVWEMGGVGGGTGEGKETDPGCTFYHIARV